jgi:uncharacterized protein
MVLATVGATGEPQTAPLFFVAAEDLVLYFISDKKSRHSRNLVERPLAALSIYTETRNWKEITGIQIEGSAQRLDNPDEIRVGHSLFQAKFPFIISFAAQIRSHEWFRFNPTWVRWIDNRVRFGHKIEISFK